MKKILSFLTKKPLAMAAVALFSMGAYAADDGTYEIWAKVGPNNLLKLYDKVTVVDEVYNVQYADDGKDEPSQLQAVEFVKGKPASNSSFFYVWKGLGKTPSDNVFNLNVKEEPTETDKAGYSINVNGALEHRTVNAQVSWFWELVNAGEPIYNAGSSDYFLYYDYDGDKIFKATNSPLNPAVLYKATSVSLPVFNPKGGEYKVNDGSSFEVEITNSNPATDGAVGDSKLFWREKGKTEWNEYTGKVDLKDNVDKGKVTLEAYVSFGKTNATDGNWVEENKTTIVEETYNLISLVDPVITPPSGELKVNNVGEFLVKIEEETEGAEVYYTYAEGTDAADSKDLTEKYTDEFDLGEFVGKTVTVTAVAKKSTLTSNVVSTTYTLQPHATPRDLFTGIKAKPEPDTQVHGGETIRLWFELLPDLADEFKKYEIEPNVDVAKKDLQLTFKGKTEPVPAKTSIVLFEGKYVVAFDVPVGKDYVKTEFDVAVPAGFYKATSGKNVVLTDAKTVHYTTGLGGLPYYVEMPTMLLPTDATSVTVRIYPNNQRDAVVDFIDQNDPVKGVQFGNSEDELETSVEKIEKTGEPNTFTVTFTNKEGQDEFIKKWILNKDGQINEKGFVIGFPANTFVDENDMANEDQISTHINFFEAVDFKIESEEWDFCEGSDDIVITVSSKGSLTGTEFNDIKLAEGKKATITGKDWRGNTVTRTGKIEPITPKVIEDHRIGSDVNTDNMYVVTFGTFQLPEDYGFMADDKNHPYSMTIPAGTFTSNQDTSEEITKDLNVMAHPVWEVKANPYTYDTEAGATTLTLDITATLDNTHFTGPDMDKKLFELPIRKFMPENMVLVDDEVVEWELSNVVTDEMRTADGMLYQTGVLTLTLNKPITDVAPHKIKILKGALKANACRNSEMEVDVYPYVEYGIDKVHYVVPSTQKSVSYNIWGLLPDGSRLPAGVIKYVGNTDDPKVDNAVAFNNQKVNPSDKVESRFPSVASTEAGTDAEGQDVTVFTIAFEEGQLWVANFQMNFPIGTVQAEGYNANDGRLYNNFDVISGLEYDATSSFADYMVPTKENKEKEYKIRTDKGSITLYLTAVDVTNKYDSNANKAIELEDGTPLTIVNDNDETEVANSWKKVVDDNGEISYTVTFTNGGLAAGVYTLTVPEETVAPLVLKDYTYAIPLGVKNPDAFELKIYVEDFDGPEDAVVMTTKDWEFPVKGITGLKKVVEKGPAITLDGKAVKATCAEGTLTVTLPGEDAYEYMTSGDYELTIPVGAIEGEYTTNYEPIKVDVKVIYEFMDYVKNNNDPKGKDLTTTVAQVEDGTTHDLMYYTRILKKAEIQGLAVPFDLTQKEVEKYFTIYKIQTVTVREGEDKDEYMLNFVPIGKDGTAYANKPYIIKPVVEVDEEKGTTCQIELKSKKVETPDIAKDIKASTTKAKFDFKNTIEPMTFASAVRILGRKDGKVGLGENFDCNPWRWYMETTDKTDVIYVKIAINGVEVDATGIDFVEAAEGDNLIFNVAGQKLNAPAKGKVNIINGKKVFVK